jgi:ethanolamine utilization protein EutN
MLIGRVVGTVVSTQKEPRLAGLKLLVVRNLDLTAREAAGFVVAVDMVGAGTGEVVLYVRGSSARQSELTDRKPVDAAIMAIVDSWDMGGHVVFDKSRE